MRATITWLILLILPLIIGLGGIVIASAIPLEMQPWFSIGWFIVFGPGALFVVWVADRYWP